MSENPTGTGDPRRGAPEDAPPQPELRFEGFGSARGRADPRISLLAGGAKYKAMSPARLPITRSPCVTIPPGFSPSAPLESPVLSDIKVPGNLQKESRLVEKDRLSNSQGTSRESSKLGQDRSRLSREVLEALFTAPERSEEEPKRKRPEMGSNRRRGVGRTVVSGPPDTVASTPLSELLNPREVDIIDDEDEYQGLYRTVKLHWDKMNTYYEEAVESFAKGDCVQANYLMENYLMEQGHVYRKLVWEVDEKTTGYYNRTTVKEDGEPTVEIKETRKSVIQADITLDLHVHTAREAVRMLKFHISSLASIPSFKYLEVIVDSDGEEDATKGKRRRLVNKLLERESIIWIEEEENPGTIFIQLDLIDPAELSFTNPLE